MRVFEVPASSIFRIEELFLYDEDGGSRPLWNVGLNVSSLRRQKFSYSMSIKILNLRKKCGATPVHKLYIGPTADCKEFYLINLLKCHCIGVYCLDSGSRCTASDFSDLDLFFQFCHKEKTKQVFIIKITR
jgi:hypothetical protein